MNKIKTFNDTPKNCEDEINKWLAENPNYNIVFIDVIHCYDKFNNTGELCNQWHETVIYCEEKSNG